MFCCQVLAITPRTYLNQQSYKICLLFFNLRKTLSLHEFYSKTCYILGDCRINLMDVQNDNHFAEFIKNYQYSLLPTFYIYAYYKFRCIITNGSISMKSAVITSDVSDHLPICLVTYTSTRSKQIISAVIPVKNLQMWTLYI